MVFTTWLRRRSFSGESRFGVWPGKPIDPQHVAESWWLRRLIIHDEPIGNHENAVWVGLCDISSRVYDESSIQLPVLCPALPQVFGSVSAAPVEVGSRGTGQKMDCAALA